MRRHKLLAVTAVLGIGCQSGPAATSGMDASTSTDVPITTTTDSGTTPSEAGSGDDNPTNVHLNWSDDPSTTVAAVWSTTMNTVNGYVNYGISPTALTQMWTGTVNIAGTAPDTVTVHEAHITGLTPSTTYYYQVGTPGHWSAVNHFVTQSAPGDANADMWFAVSGDARDSPSIWGQVQAQIQTTMTMNPPSFEVFSGDAVLLGTVQSEWDEWFSAAEPIMANLPFLMAMGNHDALAVNYVAQFAQPTVPAGNQKVYFSLNVGPVHFVVLNDTPPNLDYSYVTGTEANFLSADLAAVDRTMTPWVIVVNHKPPYDSSTHAMDSDVAIVRMAWPPIFDHYHVDLVLNGHDHDLEVTRPIYAGVSASTGTTYITAAGAGAVLYPSGTSSFTLYSESVVNFLAIHVTPHLLDVQPYRLDGTAVTQAHVTFNH